MVGNFRLAAADQANRHELLKPLSWLGLIDEEALIYNGGNSCWESLINKIKDYTENNGGAVSATYYNDENLKPKWKTIKGVLQSVEPITVIPCN